MAALAGIVLPIARQYRRRKVKGVSQSPLLPIVPLQDNYDPSSSFTNTQPSSTVSADAHTTTPEDAHNQAIKASLVTAEALREKSNFSSEDTSETQLRHALLV